jgi:hypothetical protein
VCCEDVEVELGSWYEVWHAVVVILDWVVEVAQAAGQQRARERRHTESVAEVQEMRQLVLHRTCALVPSEGMHFDVVDREVA